jgi:hypothetical protein
LFNTLFRPDTANSGNDRKVKKINLPLPGAIKSIIKFLSVTLIILCLCGYLFFQALGNGLCGTEIFQEVYSPDNEYKAVVFQRDCGATTGFTTQISILKPSKDLPNQLGNVLVMDGHPDWTNVQVRWDTNRSVSVSYSESYRVISQKEKYWYFLSSVDITYEPIE